MESDMRYDIVPIKKIYRGMGRLLLAADFFTKHTKKIYDDLLDMYFNYLSFIQEIPSESGFLKLIDYYNILKANGINCEVIVYDVVPLTKLWGYDLDFLGIDIVHEMAESLLEECVNKDVNQYLNENGLCKSKDDVSVIIPLLDHGNVKWDPCYIYKVNC